MCVPYTLAFFYYRGALWKAATFYALFCSVNAVYDAGVYLHFFMHGPAIMRKIMELDEQSSFASIQTRLFMRYCAAQEIKKATTEVARKQPQELVLVRSLRNQWRDVGMRWVNTLAVLGVYKPSTKKEE